MYFLFASMKNWTRDRALTNPNMEPVTDQCTKSTTNQQRLSGEVVGNAAVKDTILYLSYHGKRSPHVGQHSRCEWIQNTSTNP